MARALIAIVAISLVGCSSFTSIKREDDGKYVLAGWEAGQGFVWVCDYDPATKTLTVIEKR